MEGISTGEACLLVGICYSTSGRSRVRFKSHLIILSIASPFSRLFGSVLTVVHEMAVHPTNGCNDAHD